MSVLEVTDLNKYYRVGFIPQVRDVLKGVSFSISSGSITGFLGANGAGKTTTIKCILGLSFPQSGDVKFFSGQTLSSEVKKKIGFLPEHPYFYDYLTGREFLQFYGQLSTKLSRKVLADRIDQLLKRVDLFSARDIALRGYSKGMLQKIGLAQALIHEPELIILDEPMAGLDPDGRYYLSEIIRETAISGTAVFFSSHLLNDAEKLCDKLVILKDGRVQYEGSTLKLLEGTDDSVDIIFSKDGQSSKVTVENLELAQKRIDQLRQEGCYIIELNPVRMSLEEAFVSMAMRKSQ